jgi:group I intron endonuclease
MTAGELEEFHSTTASAPRATNAIGVYRVTCTINHMCYTGWSKTVLNRLYWHKSHLRNGKHSRRQMLKDFLEYGEESFRFEVISTFASEEAAIRHEAELIGEAFKRGKAYNAIVPVDDGVSWSERKERKAKRAEEEKTRAAQAEADKIRQKQERIDRMKRELIHEWRSHLIEKIRTRNDDKGFVFIIDRFLECAAVSPEDFGRQAVRDANFVYAVHAPDAPGCSLRVANQVFDFIEAYLARFECDNRDFMPILASAEKLVVIECERWKSWLSHVRAAA